MSDLNDLGDLKGHMAIHLLESLLERGKITQEQHDSARQKFEALHSTIVNSFSNQKQLPLKLKKLQVDLKQKKEQLDSDIRHQEELEGNVKAVAMEIKKLDQEIEMHSRVVDQMQNEYDKNQSSLFEKEMNIQEEEKGIRQKIQVEEEGLKQQIDRLKDDILKRQNNIEFENKFLGEQKQRIELLQKENGEILNEVSEKQGVILMIKDEPVRFLKKADMLESACRLMDKDLADINEEIAKKNKLIQEQLARITELQERNSEYVIKNNEDQQKITEDKKSIKSLMDAIKETRLALEENLAERYKISIDIKAVEKECANRGELQDTIRNQIELTKKQYKKQEHVKKHFKDGIIQQEMSIGKYLKESEYLLSEIKKLQSENSELLDEAKLTEFKARQVVGKNQEKLSQMEQIEKQIVELDTQLNQQQQFEMAASKKIKTLTNMRESMARKASQAMSEVRETREELKIKELTILDLMKRHQETEFKLNAVKALYEEAKSARNKYVNMIQNSSQELAELKEKIKISQNELEILKNEAQEKTQSLSQYSHTLQLNINLRDRENTRLNKLEFQKVAKKKIVDQNVNEIEKLNMSIGILEKEMGVLRKKYEIGQESRNYTGVQLIDRNDELCVLYEKSNIHEKILKQGEFEIKDTQDEQRMIQIEIDEKKRQIGNAQKQIDFVPKLAQEVVDLKINLKTHQEEYYVLSDKLEDPSNPVRWRELGGEDPDNESLEARIDVFEQRLNKKKEELLEKDLILDEINNLSGKLRSEALDNRQVTLEVTEKLNEFQFRLKKITRQMMATISELSMYQAMAIKLQKEREEISEQLEISKTRVQDSKPPTIESELDYQKLIRDQLNYSEQRKLRLEKEHMEKNFPPFATKTTAEHRVNAYVPDEIGIPKPYGSHAPFKPSTLVNQLRHYKNPTVKDIEI